MADLESKTKKGGSKLARSEITTIRLDPRLRYLAELAARKQRRTLSSFIEWAIEDSLGRFPLKEGEDWVQTVGDEAAKLWDVDVADRLAKLGLHYPDLLTHDEQVLWKLIRENGYLWKGRYSGPSKVWSWDLAEHNLMFDRLRENWDIFLAVAAGELPAVKLPQWHRTEVAEMNGGFDQIDWNVRG
ncbi:hypothetical protein LJR038_005038 [Acidovorax sp. LjRoot38]|uniref:hypothetical protein n=1 Tax=Acidovorax sp. LjRoot38 TaxID=3342327 RepID=UPI003ECF286D